MEFLGISFWEVLLIAVVILVVLGPSKIPGVMRTIGTIIRNIRKTTSELTTSISREIDLDNARKAGEPAPKPTGKRAADFLPKHLADPPATDQSKHDEQ